ncbi:MAG TPA: maleylpyruvate isomerase N-terminal domain-containing protein [Ktedonobacterales bacterium]|jgi:uncharacterized protein (TIGR03083 family)
MTQSELLSAMQTERAHLDAALAEVGEARMTQPGVEGDWSIKDLVAHIVWYEREMVALLQTRTLAGSDLWNLPNAERNAAIFAQGRERPLQDVLREAQHVYAQLLEQARTLSDEEINDARRFQGMPEAWVPWRILAENTWEHYRDHAASIRVWLNQ